MLLSCVGILWHDELYVHVRDTQYIHIYSCCHIVYEHTTTVITSVGQ